LTYISVSSQLIRYSTTKIARDLYVAHHVLSDTYMMIRQQTAIKLWDRMSCQSGVTTQELPRMWVRSASIIRSSGESKDVTAYRAHTVLGCHQHCWDHTARRPTWEICTQEHTHTHTHTRSAAVVLCGLYVCEWQNNKANDTNPEANVAQVDSYFIIGPHGTPSMTHHVSFHFGKWIATNTISFYC